MKDDSKFSNFLFKYFFITDIESLSTKEKIRFASIHILLPSIILLWIFVKCHDWTILLLLCGIYVLYGGACYPLFFHNKLKTQYDFYSAIRIGATYQSISKNFSFLIPGLIMIVLTGGIILENINIAVLIAFALLLPFLALFYRIDVFNDNSCILGDEIVFGYHPTCYGIISLLLGIYGYLKVYSLLNYNFNLAIIIFIITVIVQIMFLIPDKINKHLFFELRRKNGFLLYAVSLILTFLVMSSVISDTAIINLNYIDLSFESIIKLIITWGVGIGLAILFARKIKKMDKK